MQKKSKKNKIQYVCTECGYDSLKWLGNCPNCGAWNSFKEFHPASDETPVGVGLTSVSPHSKEQPKPVSVDKIDFSEEARITTDLSEFDRVLGGGIVLGSLILLGGSPGIGKSTILLQISNKLAQHGDILYVSGEESLKQIKLRCKRLSIENSKIHVFSEVNLSSIENTIREMKPKIVIIDSVQTMFSDKINSLPGSVSQLKEAATHFLRIAKNNDIPIFLIGHVTKEGVIAGPKVLEHIVDTVLYIEEDMNSLFRILRAVKNRFGSVNEIGVFKMCSEGLEEVLNPSEIFLEDYDKSLPGTAIASVFEGTRPLLLEIQSLVSVSNYPNARRSVNGTDLNKVYKIITVLEKTFGLNLSNRDVYVNVIGGFSIREPAIDLGVSVSIFSSLKSLALSKKSLFIGEVGLLGEVRGVSNVVPRVKEASKLGIERVIIPAKNLKEIAHERLDIEIIGVKNIKQAIEQGI